MAKFKHISGGIAEVFTLVNINRLRNDKNYSEIPKNTSERVKPKNKKTKQPKVVEEVVKNEPLQ